MGQWDDDRHFQDLNPILPPILYITNVHRDLNRQCDQIWRNFGSVAKSSKSWSIIGGLFTIWQNFEPTLANFVYFWANFH